MEEDKHSALLGRPRQKWRYIKSECFFGKKESYQKLIQQCLSSEEGKRGKREKWPQ